MAKIDPREFIKGLRPYADWGLEYPQPIEEPERQWDKIHQKVITNEDISETEISIEAWYKWKQDHIPDNLSVPESVVFIDGRMRVHSRFILYNREPAIIGEAIAGGIILKEGYLHFDFSSNNPPQIKRVLTLPVKERDRAVSLGIQGSINMPIVSSKEYVELYIVSSDVDASEAERAYSALLETMRALERELVNHYFSNSEHFIIKDGTLRPPDRTFIKGRGPIGLIKRIYQEELTHDFFGKFIYNLKKGERSPFFCYRISENHTIVKVISYMRIAESPANDHPMRGIVKVELLADENSITEKKSEIAEAFDFVSTLLPKLTKVLPIPRSPENIFPIMSLEKALTDYFLPSELIKTSFERWTK
ncbi:MAG: hypothetical protein J7L41_03745 [Synergistetes bacterium]|nr:hypothetical protein [Synergistota bacterium]